MIEDSVRRRKGEFFTPTPFVDLAHKYIEETFGYDWKDKFVVWDCAWGTGNLTRDFKFKELYVSTLEQSDIDTANQMGYNPEATKFQYDFLNDGNDKLPTELKKALMDGKEILFLINPPYAAAKNMGANLTHKAGVSDTKIGSDMRIEDWGASTQQLYAQFLYKMSKYQEVNKNIKIGVFCPALFFSGGSYEKFRDKFFNQFGFERGFLFQASHFADVAAQWGISFSIHSSTPNGIKTDFIHDLIDYNELDLVVQGQKNIYNTDGQTKMSEFSRVGLKQFKTINAPQMTSAIRVKDSNGRGTIIDSINYLGTFHTNGNNVYHNATVVGLYTSCNKSGHSHSVFSGNFYNVMASFAARKSIQADWMNCKDEYLAPNEQHPLYEQFGYDAIVYSLFNNSSQQSSLRQVTYKNKLWDIKNEFFWLSKAEMLKLAEDNNYDELHKDAKFGDERFVFKKLFQEGIYNKLSPDAKEVLDAASELLRKSIQMRKMVSDNHPEYHLNSFDAGYAQLKLVWKEYFKDEFKVFRGKYTAFEDRMRPLVYELGFLKK